MKIAVLSSHTGSLFWFRMDMMKDFIDSGHTVIALGPEPEADWKDKFKEHGVEYRELFVERNGTNPIRDMKTFFTLHRFMKEEKPDSVFAYHAKTIFYGSIAARLRRIKEFYVLIAGLGSVLRGRGFKNSIIKAIMRTQYRIACSVSKRIFFQNHDDEAEFVNHGLVRPEKTVIINGSGVNLDKFKPAPIPENPAFLYVGRLIRDKGVMEYLRACREIKRKHPDVRCLLVGPYDSNPSAITPEELKPYTDDNTVAYFGEQSDVRPYMAQCSAYVLPSYHEGTPKTVLEAMAMGRPVITSNAPGCRETVTDGVNGFLVDVKDVDGLVAKMEILIAQRELCNTMGESSLALAREKYDVKKVNLDILKAMSLV